MHDQTAFLNGDYVSLEEANISVLDRGFLFGDGVYEVIPVYKKKPFELQPHLERLKQSLKGTLIHNPYSDLEWQNLIQSIIDRHPWDNQFVYLQITRGIQSKRDHLPEDNLDATVLIYTSPLQPISDQIKHEGISVITLEDIRWLHCDIKAITLLPNVMMKLAAKQRNAQDAILIRENGEVTEGTASNLFIVKNGVVKTTPNSHKILPGITRSVTLSILDDLKISVLETQLTITDLETADEIWLTSSTKDALPITKLDEKPVGKGRPGEVWKTISAEFPRYKEAHIQSL